MITNQTNAETSYVDMFQLTWQVGDVPENQRQTRVSKNETTQSLLKRIILESCITGQLRNEEYDLAHLGNTWQLFVQNGAQEQLLRPTATLGEQGIQPGTLLYLRRNPSEHMESRPTRLPEVESRGSSMVLPILFVLVLLLGTLGALVWILLNPKPKAQLKKAPANRTINVKLPDPNPAKKLLGTPAEKIPALVDEASTEAPQSDAGPTEADLQPEPEEKPKVRKSKPKPRKKLRRKKRRRTKGKRRYRKKRRFKRTKIKKRRTRKKRRKKSRRKKKKGKK